MAQLSTLGIIRRIMKIAFPVLALGLVLTACSRHDAKPTQQIVGSWTSASAGTIMTISPDGSWLLRNMASGHTNTFAGTWQIKDGFFTMMMTNSPNPNRPSSVGDVVRYKIVHVDEHQFIFQERGRIVTLTR